MCDDDMDMDEWMNMTDDQQGVMLEREMRKHEQWYNSLTLKQQIKYQTCSAMYGIMENRKRLRNPELCTIEYVTNIWRSGIRRNQRRLLKIRIWRTTTGVYPGEA